MALARQACRLSSVTLGVAVQGLLFLDLSKTRDPAVLDRAEALSRWQNQRNGMSDCAGDAQSREQVLVLERTQDQYDREAEQIERWTTAHPDTALSTVDGIRGTGAVSAVSAVVAHRHSWRCSRLTGYLSMAGVDVVGAVEDAPSVIAALVVTQPDVLLTSDRLLGGQGLQMLVRAAELSPRTRIVVEIDVESRHEEARQAGADAVLSQRAPVETVVSTVSAVIEAS